MIILVSIISAGIPIYLAITRENFLWCLLVVPLMIVSTVFFGEISRKKTESLKLDIIENLKNKGFIVAKRSSDLLIDQENKKWCVIDEKCPTPYIHNFSDIIDFKILENGVEYKSDGTVIRAVVGGALFGVLGAAAGASTAKKKTTIDSISVVVTTSDFNKPSERIHISGPVADVTSSYYNLCVDKSNEIMGLLASAKAIANV